MNQSGTVGTADSRTATARRRGYGRFAALATATALAVGAFTATAHAAGTPSANPLIGARIATPKPVTAPTPKLDLGAFTTNHAKANVATASGWTIPSEPVWQNFSGQVDEGTATGFKVLIPAGGVLYREVLNLGDVNGDSADDILTISASGHMQLVLGNSGGTVQLGGGWQTYNRVVVVGDVNGDGRADLVARDTAGSLWYYASTRPTGGTASFAARKLVGTGWGSYDQLVGVSQFDTGAAASLVARDLQGNLWLYDAKADGTYAARKKIGTNWTVYNQILSADVNGDGHSDLVGRTQAGTLKIYLGSGAGTTSGGQTGGSGWYGVNLLAGQGGASEWGKTGLYARNAQGTVFWYGAYDNGLLGKAQQVGTQLTPKLVPVLNGSESLDDSGRAGLLAATAPYTGSAGDLWDLFDTNGSGNPLESNVGYTKVLGLGDVTGDGNTDLLARDKAGYLWLIPGNGVGGVHARKSLGAGWNMFNRIIGAGDTTGDGLPDILATTPAGALYLYPGRTGGGFGARISLGGGWNYITKLAVPGDITGDGRSDIAAVDSAGTLWDYPSIGGGHFGARVKVWVGGWNGYTDIS